MDREIRTICYDEALRIEAYRLEGVVQAFPNHFHEHYVLGLLERGVRSMTCQNRNYTLGSGPAYLCAATTASTSPWRRSAGTPD